MKLPQTTELTHWHIMTVCTLPDKSVTVRTEIMWPLLCTDGRTVFRLKK